MLSPNINWRNNNAYADVGFLGWSQLLSAIHPMFPCRIKQLQKEGQYICKASTSLTGSVKVKHHYVRLETSVYKETQQAQLLFWKKKIMKEERKASKTLLVKKF